MISTAIYMSFAEKTQQQTQTADRKPEQASQTEVPRKYLKIHSKHNKIHNKYQKTQNKHLRIHSKYQKK